MAVPTHSNHTTIVVAFIRRLATVCAWTMALGLAPGLNAGVLYWDTNGGTVGAGSTPNGTWSTSGGTNKNWNDFAPDGTLTAKKNTVNWTSGSDAVFSAGFDATGAYTVTVSGTQNVSSIWVEDGNPTFTGGTINFNDTTPDIIINSGRTLTFNSALTTSTGGLSLSGGGAISLGGTLNLGATLKLSDVNLTVGSLNLTSNSTIDFSGSSATLDVSTLNLNGFTLSVINWTAAVDYFYAQAWTGATFDVMGSAPMNQVTFNGFSASQTGWDSYDKQIRPNVPEPSTYGAILLGSLTGFALWRRRRSA